MMNEKITAPSTIGGARKHIAAGLGRAGVENAMPEARLILSEALNLSPAEIEMRDDEIVPEGVLEFIAEIVDRRIRREPLQYILGYAYFMDLVLAVTPAVLIPRAESEILVEWALGKAVPGARLLDIGTGSGAIALALGHGRRDLEIVAVDISADALEVAQHNRIAARIDNVSLRQSDLFSALTGEKFDLITANLPYIAESDYPALMDEVRLYEPKLALTSGSDGLDLIRRCAAEASGYLNDGGRIIFEIGDGQGAAVADLLGLHGFSEVRIMYDYNERERFVSGQKNRPLRCGTAFSAV